MVGENLLAAIALQHVHRVDGDCVAADRFAVVFHDCPCSFQNFDGITHAVLLVQPV